MTNNMMELCDAEGVDFQILLDKVRDGINGVSISHFTDEQLKVIAAALEIAGEL